MTLSARLAAAVGAGRVSGRLWLYSNYHCNLACAYCLAESSPTSPRRELGRARMLELAGEARDLGFTGLGVTGGEPFLLPWFEEAAAELAAILPLTVLTNGTLFTDKRLRSLARLADADVRLQISLDRPDPDANDALRGLDNFAKVVVAIPKLLGLGLRVRVATTLPSALDDQPPEEAARLRDLVRGLGVADEDHVVRKLIDRGRAGLASMGVPAPLERLPPELTITADGAFWSPFAPTYRGGRLQTDLLLTRTTRPLATPVAAMLGLVSATPVSDGDLAVQGFV